MPVAHPPVSRALVALLLLAPAPLGAQTVLTAPEIRVRREIPRDHVTQTFPESAFAEERAITRAVRDLYGPGAPLAGARRVPESVTAALRVGAPLPAGAEARPVPGRLAERLPPDIRWVAVGEHLVGLGPDDRVTRVYHDMLP